MTIKHKLTSLAISGILAAGAAGPAQAKHGADDPAGHDRGDDHGAVGKHRHHKKHRHNHHNHANDDGANHS